MNRRESMLAGAAGMAFAAPNAPASCTPSTMAVTASSLCLL